MITDFREKRLREYLRPGQRVLIRFGHGLGDTIMFMPLLDRLRKMFPETQIDLYVESGQEEIWESVADKDAPGYDYVFSLDFPMAEGGPMTKPGKCCADELGIYPSCELAKLPECDSPLVGVHFQGTALPGSVGCQYAVAEQVWREILAAGKQPIETHFEHQWHNPANERFGFIGCHVRECEAKLRNLFGLLQRCYAFIGVASGPFVAALSIMPERCLYLQNRHAIETYTNLEVPVADVNDYREGTVLEWLNRLD